MKMRALLIPFLLAATAVSTFADGFIIIHNPPPWPHPHPRPMPHPAFAPLSVVHHNVDVVIDGQKATTRVDQEFFNSNHTTLEGEYLFPIPDGAHIDRFTMRVGDRDLEAELLDADKARKIYEDIVRKQRDPALLEYTGRAAFRVRIFPIEPRSRKKVQIVYTQLLRNDAGLISYLYPLNTEKFSAEPLRHAAIKVEIRQPAAIKALYSPSHTVEVRRDGERRATVDWETSNARPDRDFQLLFSTAESDVGVSLLTHKTGSDEGSFLLLASPGADVLTPGEKPNPKDVIFVLDTSGSMAGAKLEQARRALSFCVENLNDTDRFEILKFATDTEACFEKLVDVTRANRVIAQNWIEGLKPIGGTAIHDALQQALRLRPRSSERPFIVIFLTDGQPTIGETDEGKIVASVASEAANGEDGPGATTRIFCFGIGTDVNTHLLDKIVERTRAASQFVLPEEDLELKVSSFFTRIKEPILTNLKITWPAGVRVSKVYPSPPPDLFRGDQLVLAGRYQGAGEGEIMIEGELNGRTRRIMRRVRFEEREPENEFIPQLWALRRVGWLLDEIRLRGESAELRDEVVQLAREYAIITPYTSYLIVEDEARRHVPPAFRSVQGFDDRMAMERLAQNAASARVEKTGEFSATNARANAELKYAGTIGDSLARAQEASKRAVFAGPSPAGASAAGDAVLAQRIDAVQQNVRVVNGRAFYQNGTQWLDAEAQRQRAAKTVRLQFASSEYFQLLADQPEAAPWLALGRNVQFMLEDTFYEVVD